MKILHWDCETSPNLADVWSLWNVNVSLNQLRESSFMMCWAAKWHNERTVKFSSFHRDGKTEMVSGIWKLMDEADAVVTYNGHRFDRPTLNKEFLLEGLDPPSPSKQIDLYSVVKKHFKFPSSKLAYVSEQLGLGSKESHEGHSLWVKCLAGDEAAWRKMERYNKQDVILLEKLYGKLLPWITNHPNYGLYGGHSCPNCGGDDLRREGFAQTANGSYQRYQCRTCSTWSRDCKRTDGVAITQEKF